MRKTIIVQTGFDKGTNEPRYRLAALVGGAAGIYKTSTGYENPEMPLEMAIEHRNIMDKQ